MTLRYPSPVRRAALALTAASLLAALATGCGSKAEPALAPVDTATASQSASASPAPTASAADPTAAFLAPLTGLPTEQAITRRPLSVMINNFKAARPQSGLTHADTVWEILAEGGITRLVAIFQSQTFDDPIGPIRSIRPYLIDIGETYGGVLVHAGASNDALAILQHSGKADMDEINNAGAYFYRSKDRKAPHNLYSTQEKLYTGARKLKYDETALVPLVQFDPTPDVIGEPAASQIDLKFQLSDYKVSYRYDASTHLYARSVNDQPHIDLNNSQQLTAANLVVLSAKHRAYDDYGRLEIDLKSGGEAMLFQEGRAISCEWKRAPGDIIRIYRDGRELKFLPGTTYYHVVPTDGGFASHVTYE
ncbi:DUF3048 domain-containing protein [Cohnella hashimotonis]|uniref:DUF3048 domain-containing protein n=1 Tax=Cohnella hashimotonis TaxID=2826895 RepID=A0ABT6TMS5_9BACL|nr:DUF3048 domain-containing protein [Cohnella hashimotonis]MDI4648167.1 DUF3048 domain-containing protein [Cohnella hashimotonis]